MMMMSVNRLYIFHTPVHYRYTLWVSSIMQPYAAINRHSRLLQIFL